MMTRTYMSISRALPALLGVCALSTPIAAVSGEQIDQTLAMPADGLIEIPPESKVKPLPTRHTVPPFVLPLGVYSI